MTANSDAPIRIIIVVKKRIASWVEGRHEAWGALILLSLFAALVEVAYARYGSAHPAVPFLGVAAYALSIALAALIIGIFLGFLFGIPRTLSGNGPTQRRPAADGKAAASESGVTVTVGGSDPGESSGNGGPNFGVNTNLEQISDWLTKIMVGVGLTQIAKLPGAVKVLADALKPGFGDVAGAGTLGVLIVTFFSVCGFLIGYLWTRIYLTKEFVNAEFEATARLAAKVSTMETATAQVAAALSTVEAQPDKDATALNLVQKQMDPTIGDSNPVEQGRLNQALKEGSPALKVQVFYMARKIRKNAKGTPDETKAACRVIPIFRALSACDETNRYHRTHAQLAYALLDQDQSDIQGAIAEVEKAIAIRDDHSTPGYWNYEVFRALCRIRLQESVFMEPNRSALKVQILTDLKRAAREGLKYVRDEPRALAWMQVERVSEADLLAPGV